MPLQLNPLCTVYPFIVCTRLRVFVIIFAEMLARQTEAGRGAAEGFSKPCKPLTGILYMCPPPRLIHFPGIACGLFPGNSSYKLISPARSLARSPVCHSRPLFTLTFKISHFAERRTRKSGRADGRGAAVSNAAALAGDLCGRRN